MTIIYIGPGYVMPQMGNHAGDIEGENRQAIVARLARARWGDPATFQKARNDKQVGVFEIFRGFLPRSNVGAQNGITKRGAQAVEDRCTQQKSLNAFGLLFQDLFNQIVQLWCLLIMG
jgi:hypothetical protein